MPALAVGIVRFSNTSTSLESTQPLPGFVTTSVYMPGVVIPDGLTDVELKAPGPDQSKSNMAPVVDPDPSSVTDEEVQLMV